MKKSVCGVGIGVLLALLSGSAYAASGVWNGTQSACWTNSANWSASPYPSGSDTASFTNAGNGQTILDVAGLSGIKYVVFGTNTAAAYTVGSGGANAQTLTLAADGQVTLASSAAADQTFAAAVQLPGNYTFANNAAGRTLAFNSVTGTTADKSLTFSGSGAISIAGNLSRGNNALNVYANGTGPITLAGVSNQVTALWPGVANAVINLAAGSLTTFANGGGGNINASQDAVINGPGAIMLSTAGGENFADNGAANGKTLTINAKLTGPTGFEYWHGSYFGTIALLGQNDFTLNVIMNAGGTISVTNIGNQASMTSNLGSGSRVIFNSTVGGASRLRYTGVGEDTDRILEFRQSGIVEQAGPGGLLKFTSGVMSSGSPTATLQGSTAGTGEMAAAIQGSAAVAKAGTGTWFLSASNTYSGATTVNAGNLILCGTNGSARSTSGLTLNGGAFVLLNTLTSNLTDRLSDAVPVTLNGGTFCFSNDLSAVAFSEAVGALTVAGGAGTIAVMPAADGQTSSLRFASIVRNAGASVNFVGEGLGDSDRARVFITGQGDGLIGTWATVNGTGYAAYSSTRGVYAAPLAVDIAARGYSVITNDAALAVRISYPGEAGPITLETSPASTVGSLIQNSDTEAVVATTNTFFTLSEVVVATTKASLTVGTSPHEGTLATLSPGGRLTVENNSTNGVLTVNANIVTNGTTCSLIKNGDGKVVLAGENTYGGATIVSAGELAFGSGNHAIGQMTVGTASFILTNAAASHVYVTNNSAYIGNNSGEFGRMVMGGNCAWSGYLYPKNVGQTTLVIGNYGRGLLTLQDSASVTQRLYVGNNSGSAGAVYQNGGTMHNWGGSSSDPRIGVYGYGYYELNSGTFTNMGWTQLGFGFQSIGILKQFGGAFKMGSVYDGNLGISRGGTGVVYVAGGTFTTSTTLGVGESSDNNATNGFAEFTLAGGTADINGNIYMAERTSMVAVVNLNGGTLAANAISRGVRRGAFALVNFNGGKLVARTSGNLFGTGTSRPDFVNLYAGGATIDTSNQNCTVLASLSAPAGSGVTSIGVTPRGGYIGPPMVTIAGGGGTGATAVAEFDSASGSVTGIRVTSPGFGYTSTPTVRLSGGGTNVQTTVGTATLGANLSGGLTKLGMGMLTLAATNTYAGATIVSNGTLRLAVPQAVPTNSTLTLAGGSLDLAGQSYTQATLTVTGGGQILNGTLACGSLVQSGGNLALGAPVEAAQPIRIDGGVMQMTAVRPGLYEARLAGAFNTVDANPCTNVQLTTRAANVSLGGSTGLWVDNSTYIYSGYIWNRAETNVTWTFAEQFDDSVQLKIDSTTVINGGGGWNTPTIGTLTLSPGAHAFEARFGQASGGVGAPTSFYSWWTTYAMAFGVDYLGRNETNIANYVALTDPGDCSLLTLNATMGGMTNRIGAGASVELGAAGVLDLGTNVYSQTLANLSGSGIVSNGTLAVTGAIAPGGTNAIGTLTVANSAGLSGKLLIDVAADGSSDKLAVAGSMSLSGLSLEIANPSQLNTWKIYTVATVSGTLTGTFASVTVPDARWHVMCRGDGAVQLIFANGALIQIK